MSKLQNMRVVEIPGFRAVSSGANTLQALFGPESDFSKWVDGHKDLLQKHIFEPSDFLWHENRNTDTSVWALAVRDGVTAEDTYPYEIITFPGGTFLVATGDEKNPDDLNETIDCMMRWIRNSDVFEYGDFPQSGMCNMPNPDGGADAALGISQQQIFLPLKPRSYERAVRPMKRYYEAYDDRYRQVHDKSLKWFSDAPSPIVGETIRKYGIGKGAKIMEIGCGEGRDAVYLLRRGYRVFAGDVSPTAIAHCKEWFPDAADSFGVLDCLSDCPAEKFDFIYAVSVLHMLVPDGDRARFYGFFRACLADNGVGLICTMGDGRDEYQSDISKAFELQKRTHEASGQELLIAGTSCRKVCFDTFFREIENGGLALLESGIASIIPDFPTVMYAVVQKRGGRR